jgi:hypothetical protein
MKVREQVNPWKITLVENWGPIANISVGTKVLDRTNTASDVWADTAIAQ